MDERLRKSVLGTRQARDEDRMCRRTGAGLVLSTWLPRVVEEARPFLASLALLDTSACVGASLASNSDAARSRLGATVLLPVGPPSPRPPSPRPPPFWLPRLAIYCSQSRLSQ